MFRSFDPDVILKKMEERENLMRRKRNLEKKRSII